VLPPQWLQRRLLPTSESVRVSGSRSTLTSAEWPHVEKVAQTLPRERTLTAAGVKALLASQ
jgi:inner membrane protein involved in colicin E2 resistance